MTNFVKCAACGWLHFAISAADALEEMHGVNEMLERGADSGTFVAAQEFDAPPGVTIRAVVVER